MRQSRLARPAPQPGANRLLRQETQKRLVEGLRRFEMPEMADAMGIKQNYLYRVVPDLAKQGLVSKSGKGWHVRDGK